MDWEANKEGGTGSWTAAFSPDPSSDLRECGGAGMESEPVTIWFGGKPMGEDLVQILFLDPHAIVGHLQEAPPSISPQADRKSPLGWSPFQDGLLGVL